MAIITTVLSGYLGAALAGLGLGVAGFAAGMPTAEVAAIAPYFGIAGGLAGLAWRWRRSARTRAAALANGTE